MFKSWRLGRLLGFPIELNLSFLLLLAVVLVAYGGLFGVFVVTLAFASVLVHELGHAVVARALGVHVVGIELGFLGGAAKMVDMPRTANHEVLIAAAGPAVSLVLGGLGLGLGLLVGSPFLAMIGWINFVIAGFNLIPALPMDGGRILRALLSKRMGYVRATDTSVMVARVAAIAFGVIGLATGTIMLVVLAPFLWLMGTREKALARMMPAPYESRSSRYHRDGVEVLDRGAARFHRGDPWGGAFSRFTIRHRNGRLVIEPLD